MDIKEQTIQDCVSMLNNVIRSEYNDDKNYLDYYADIENINQIYNKKNQVLYGRRGTGKTHLLKAFQEQIAADYTKNKYFPVYIDLRVLKPYFDKNDSVYYSLIVLKHLFLELLQCISENIPLHFSDIKSDAIVFLNERLEYFNYHLNGNKIEKMGEVIFNTTEISNLNSQLCLSKNPNIDINNSESTSTETHDNRIKYISFQSMNQIVTDILDHFSLNRIFFLIDEWSEIDIEIQPILAELLKRLFMPNKVILKIAAIPNRTNLSKNTNNNIIGLEDGGDIFGFSLDNKYIYELNPEVTKSFFNELLFKHLQSIDEHFAKQEETASYANTNILNDFFATQAQKEVLIACAGIPRDFINLFINSYGNYIYRNATQKRISLTDVRNSTILWYDSDKRKSIDNNPDAKLFLDKIIQKVLIEKKHAHFLIPEKYENNKTLQQLIDYRIIHLRKKGISHKGNKGVSYNVYYIDYACYTSSNIYHNSIDSNLLNEIETTDDFRKIRRISLEDNFFDEFASEIGDAIKCPNCSKIVDTKHPAYIKQNMCYHCFEKIN